MAKLQYAFDEQSFKEFRSQHIQVKVAESSWEKQSYFSLRRAVFAREQKILPDNEQDGQDFRAIPIVALAANWGVNDDVVGAVRIYSQHDDDGHNLWFGGRLCVARAYRGHASIGKALINEAVARAKELGCTKFLANVQPQNEKYFHAVHWRTLGFVEIAGKPHVRMQANLAAYPFMLRTC
ncbi:putative N-acetyltransferase (TIGR04045 family) [Alteromonadaceae bacterium 2753L.S.0a.02]|nr:putative N-acetyltransferase (TIGR04045 family) [Alteromonadaceae bacterium 2753L.S.0a.02]